MTPEEALAAWDTYSDDNPDEFDPDTVNEPVYRHYKPLAAAADNFIREAQETKRVYTGVPEFDEAMRGLSPGHLGVIVGYSHSGKTQLLLHILRNNREARVAWFSPDEPATLFLAKLASITHNIPARELESQVAAGDRGAIELLVQTATEEYPNLILFDKTLTQQVLYDGYEEACDVWGGPADFVVVDYVDLVQGGGEIAPQKFDILKSFVSDKHTAMWAIHQTSRAGGAEGRAMTISSGNYGGEQHATMMIGVRRKKSAIMAELAELRVKLQKNPGSEATQEKIDALEHDLAIHEYTLTANLVKNKRPGGGLVDEIDFELGLSTGRLYRLENGDLPHQYRSSVTNDTLTQPAVSDTNHTPTWEEPEIEYTNF